MRITSLFKPATFVLTATLALGACKSVEERAEETLQSGLALIAEGDYDRAVVELRNVLQLDIKHKEARYALAEVLENNLGNRTAAYKNYAYLAEQHPDELEARIVLSQMAFEAANWTEVERHGAKAEELAADDPRVKTISIARAYRAASVDDDAPARRAQADAARALLETNPDSVILRNLIVDNDMRNGDLDKALSGVDWLLEKDPDNVLYWRQRLAMLGQLNDFDGIEAQLRQMVAQFPDEKSNKEALLRFYLSRGQQDKAEDFLRDLVALKPEEPGPTVDLIRFLSQVRGSEAALAEVDSAIQTQPNPIPFRAMRAGLIFENGQREEAVQEMETILAENGQNEDPEISEQVRSIKVTLAQMMLSTGNEVGARAHVEEVLAADGTHVQALKMQAAWMIQADESEAAISALRTALDQEPEDADAMTLMSQAYARAGRSELAREFLALAVGASGNAPEETIRYAQILIGEERYLPAEEILLPALRVAPRNEDLLITLGRLYIGMEDMGRVDQVVRTLRQINTPKAQQAANALEAQAINLQSGVEQAMSYLEGLATSEDASLASKVSLVQARLRTGNPEGALTLAQDLLAQDPDNVQLQGMMASLQAVNGDLDAAEQGYRALLELDKRRPAVWLELAQLKLRQGDPVAAQALVDEGLAATPEAANLLWAKASYLERDGNIDGAIAIYEQLYGEDSNSVVVANNLASLLSTHKQDADSLERAWNIARRFKDAQIPAMQDTYGWIVHRRGDSADAVTYLEAAAAGLQSDAVVQYHLGMAYLGTEQIDKALAQFKRTLDVAGAADQRPQIDDARAQIKAIEAAASQTAPEN